MTVQGSGSNSAFLSAAVICCCIVGGKLSHRGLEQYTQHLNTGQT